MGVEMCVGVGVSGMAWAESCVGASYRGKGSWQSFCSVGKLERWWSIECGLWKLFLMVWCSVVFLDLAGV